MKRDLRYLLAPLLFSVPLLAVAKPQCEKLVFPEEEQLYEDGSRCFWQGATLQTVWQDFYQGQQSQNYGKKLRQTLSIGKNVTDTFPEDENAYPTAQYKWSSKTHLELTLFFPGGVTTITLSEAKDGTTITEHYSAD